MNSQSWLGETTVTAEFLHRMAQTSPGVIVSHCHVCGGFVAASPSVRIILIAEALHACLRSHDAPTRLAQPLTEPEIAVITRKPKTIPTRMLKQQAG